MIRGVIFDFDGLIIDTEGPVHQSWVELFQAYNAVFPSEAWAEIIGTSNTEPFSLFAFLEELTGRKLDREALASRRLTRELELCHAQPVLPGVIDVIQDAQEMGLKLGIASSSDRKWVVDHLTRLNLLKYFEIIHTCEDVEHTKPDPALYQLALGSLKLQPEEALVLEDSPNGITAAKSAGIFVVAVPNPLTASLLLDHADLRMDSLADMTLREIIAKADGSKGKD